MRSLLILRRERSKKQEKLVASQTGGRTTIASGALMEKSDVVSCDELNLRIEAKRTDKKQITLRLEDLKKIIYEAASTGKIPCMHLEIQGHRFYLLPEHVAKEAFECLRKKN